MISPLLLALVVGAGPVPRVPMRIDAGPRTDALSRLLAADGHVEPTSIERAELELRLREAGGIWALTIVDRRGAAVLRRDIRASGGELAAMRLVAVLVENAVRAPRPRSPVPGPARTATAATWSVRAVPPLPIPASAAALLADASALPPSSTSTAAAP